jgi:hypothetical protein
MLCKYFALNVSKGKRIIVKDNIEKKKQHDHDKMKVENFKHLEEETVKKVRV